MENEKCGCEGLQNNKSKINTLKDNSGCGCEPESVKESKKVEEKEKKMDADVDQNLKMINS